jgi:hypothetical protein
VKLYFYLYGILYKHFLKIVCCFFTWNFLYSDFSLLALLNSMPKIEGIFVWKTNLFHLFELFRFWLKYVSCFVSKQFAGFFLQDTKFFSCKEKQKLLFEYLVLISDRAQAWKLSCFTKQILNGTARKDLEICLHKLRSDVGITLQVTTLNKILLHALTPHLT